MATHIRPSSDQPLRRDHHLHCMQIAVFQNRGTLNICRHHISINRHYYTFPNPMTNVSFSSSNQTGDSTSAIAVFVLMIKPRNHHPPRFQTHRLQILVSRVVRRHVQTGYSQALPLPRDFHLR